jgi:hypothetical protein
VRRRARPSCQARRLPSSGIGQANGLSQRDRWTGRPFLPPSDQNSACHGYWTSSHEVLQRSSRVPQVYRSSACALVELACMDAHVHMDGFLHGSSPKTSHLQVILHDCLHRTRYTHGAHVNLFRGHSQPQKFQFVRINRCMSTGTQFNHCA